MYNFIITPISYYFSALNYHYESQCIPTPLAWFAHQLPIWFQKLCVVATLVIEIPIPFMFFSPVHDHRAFAFYTQVHLKTVFTVFLLANEDKKYTAIFRAKI